MMAPHHRNLAVLPSLSMESSSMAPNHGAEAPHESDAGARWCRFVLVTLLPLVLCAQTWSMERGWVLAIMWPPFIHKKQQPTEHHHRQSGWFWSGDAMEVGHMERMLIRHFDHQVMRQKIKNENMPWPMRPKNKQKYMTDNNK